MAGGLSTANFMTGLVDGLNAGNQYVDTQRRREREDEQAKHNKVLQERQDEQWEMSKEDRLIQQQRDAEMRQRDRQRFEREGEQWERQKTEFKQADTLFEQQQSEFAYQKEQRRLKQRETELQRDLRILYQQGKDPDEQFLEKYSDFHVGSLYDKDWQDQKLNAGKKVVAALRTGKTGPETLDAMNAVLEPQLNERYSQDGLKRKVSSIRQLKNGNWALELEVTGKDGKPYKAPLTKNGTASPDDEVIQVSPAKLKEWISASTGQANIAHLMRTASDPASRASAAHKALFGSSIDPDSTPEYTFKEVYDKDTGTKRMAAIDKHSGKLVRYLGGAEVDGGSGGSGGSGGKLSGNNKLLWDGIQQYQKDAVTNPEWARSAFEDSFGFPVDIIHLAHANKRATQDFSPLTFEDLNKFMAQTEAYNGPGEAEAAQQEQAPVNRAAPPPAPESKEVRELREKMRNPIYPPNAQADFARQLEALEPTREAAPASVTPPAKVEKPKTFDDKMAALQSRLNSAQDLAEVTAITKEMADLAMTQNAGLSDDHYAGI